MHQQFVSECVYQKDIHLFARIAARAEEILAAQRPWILIFGMHAVEPVAVEVIAVPQGGAHAGRPGAQDRRVAVGVDVRVDDRQRAPHVAMVGAEDAQQLPGVRDDARIIHRRGVGLVVAPQDRLLGAVRIDRPEPVGVTEIPVHIFPAFVHDAPVRHQPGLVLKQRALGDLMDVRVLRIHPEQIGTNVLAAHVELRLAGGRKNDAAVRQIKRIEIAHTRRERQLPQTRAVGLDLEQMKILLGRAPHGKENPVPVEVHARAAHRALRCLDQRAGLAGGRIQQLERAAGLVTALGGLTHLEQRVDRMIDRRILRPRHKHDRLTAHQRVGQQRPPL